MTDFALEYPWTQETLEADSQFLAMEGEGQFFSIGRKAQSPSASGAEEKWLLGCEDQLEL